MIIDRIKGDGSSSRDRHIIGFKCRNECGKYTLKDTYNTHANEADVDGCGL